MKTEPLLFYLSEKVEYAKSGDFHETATFELNGPNMEVFDIATELSQLVMRSLMDAQNFVSKNMGGEEESKDSSGMDKDAMKIILLSSKNVKFSDIADVCKKLFVKVGTYDGEVKLKSTVFNKMEIEDFISLVCEYIANFTFPSLFSQTMGE